MEWINVKDRVPEGILGSYIACLKNKSVMELAYSDMSRRWWSLSSGDVIFANPVTHWMEFPEPPNQ